MAALSGLQRRLAGVARPARAPVTVVTRPAVRSMAGRGSSGVARASDAAAPPAAVADLPAQAIILTDAAIAHLKKMRAEVGGEELLLRVGVKQGGCSGMSYTMDFEAPDKIGPDDTVMTAGGEGAAGVEGLRIVCDPKSLLYLFGMQLDYSSALIGGGFSFKNPNATETCGCGTSFSV